MHSLRRNAKPLNQLKSIHTEHLNKLQYKNQLETDLIEDLRSFCKQRAQIEKDYGQSLQKLANTYLSKKEVITLAGSDEENRRPDGRSIWYVWRCLLDQTVGMAQARLVASDTQQRLSDQLKPVKMVRIATNKHIVEQLKSLQGELAASLQEMVKAHKVYVEEEKQSHDARTKAKDADDKVRKRSTNIFHSMAQLQKNSAKLTSRKEACETRSTAARNEYLFQLASVNAHLEHYFSIDITDLAKILDGEVFEKIQEVFTSVSRHELECCGLTQEHFSRVMCDAMLISREFTWNQFVNENPAFAEKVQYQYEPIEGDQVNLLHQTSSKEETLLNVARKLAKRLVQRDRQIKDYQTEMRSIQAGRVTPQHQEHDSHGNSLNNDDMLAYNQEYVEHKVEELQHAIRREEIEKVKVQACLDLLLDSGVEISSIISDAYAAAASMDLDPDVESLDQTSNHPYAMDLENDSDLYDLPSNAQFNEDERTNHSTPTSSTSANENKANWSNKRQSTTDKSRLSIDGSLDRDDHSSVFRSIDESAAQHSSGTSHDAAGIMAIALFEFQASRPDELDLVVDETVVVLDEDVADGWIKVRSLIDGSEGLIPAAFVRIDRPAEFWSEEPQELDSNADWTEVADQEVARIPSTPPPSYEIVRALYDFSGSSSDELSFPAGQLIRLISRESAPGVDDGWWEGELLSPSSTDATVGSDQGGAVQMLIQGRCSAPPETPGFLPRGFFPSMMVEPLKRSAPNELLFQAGLDDATAADIDPPITEDTQIPNLVNGTVSAPPPDTIVEEVLSPGVERPGPPNFEPPTPLPPTTTPEDGSSDRETSGTDTEGNSSSTSADESDTGTVRARDETPIKDLEQNETELSIKESTKEEDEEEISISKGEADSAPVLTSDYCENQSQPSKEPTPESPARQGSEDPSTEEFSSGATVEPSTNPAEESSLNLTNAPLEDPTDEATEQPTSERADDNVDSSVQLYDEDECRVTEI